MFELIKKFINNISDHDCTGKAAEIAYSFMFALVPGFLFFAALISFMGSSVDTLDQIMVYVELFIPGELSKLLNNIITQLLNNQSFGLVTFGIFISLYSAGSGIATVMRGLDKAYNSEKKRNFIITQLVAMLMVVGAGIFVIIAFNLILIGVDSLEVIQELLGFGEIFTTVFNILRWPVAFSFIFGAVSFLYYFSPNVKHKFKNVIPGSLFFSLSWVVATWGLTFYITAAEGMKLNLGALGSSILLMFWIYITALILLVGGELNSLLYRRKKPVHTHEVDAHPANS